MDENEDEKQKELFEKMKIISQGVPTLSSNMPPQNEIQAIAKPQDLPKTEQSLNGLAQDGKTLSRITAQTQYDKKVDDAKLAILNEAYMNDTKFSGEIKEELKKAMKKSAELEKDKAVLEQQNVKYASELLETKQQLNGLKKAEDKWGNKEKRREFYYNGVKPIMTSIGVDKPMCTPLLVLLVIVILPFFLIGKLYTATVGNLLCGINDKERSKSVKGFLWTILAIIITAIVALLAYFGLQLFKII